MYLEGSRQRGRYAGTARCRHDVAISGEYLCCSTQRELPFGDVWAAWAGDALTIDNSPREDDLCTGIHIGLRYCATPKGAKGTAVCGIDSLLCCDLHRDIRQRAWATDANSLTSKVVVRSRRFSDANCQETKKKTFNQTAPGWDSLTGRCSAGSACHWASGSSRCQRCASGCAGARKNG